MVEKGEETTVAMVEEENTVVVVKQLNVAMLHVGSFVITNCDGGGRRGEEEEENEESKMKNEK